MTRAIDPDFDDDFGPTAGQDGPPVVTTAEAGSIPSETIPRANGTPAPIPAPAGPRGFVWEKAAHWFKTYPVENLRRMAGLSFQARGLLYAVRDLSATTPGWCFDSSPRTLMLLGVARRRDWVAYLAELTQAGLVERVGISSVEAELWRCCGHAEVLLAAMETMDKTSGANRTRAHRRWKTNETRKPDAMPNDTTSGNTLGSTSGVQTKDLYTPLVPKDWGTSDMTTAITRHAALLFYLAKPLANGNYQLRPEAQRRWDTTADGPEPGHPRSWATPAMLEHVKKRHGLE